MDEELLGDRKARLQKLFYADLDQLLSRFDEFKSPEWRKIAEDTATGLKSTLSAALNEGEFK